MNALKIKTTGTPVKIVAPAANLQSLTLEIAGCARANPQAKAPAAATKLAALKKAAYQTVVVKFGGQAIGDEKILDGLINDVIALADAGIKVIVVHGGGTFVSEALAAVGKQTVKVQGLRVTDAETLAIAVKTFSQINEKLVAKFKEKGASALGFSPVTNSPFAATKMILQSNLSRDVQPDLGYVGEIVDVHASTIESWMWAGWISIVSPVGIGADGQFYNINADHAALALASQLQVDGLYFMTDICGVLQDVQNTNTRVGHLTPTAAAHLIDQGIISGGMLPKVKSCIGALQNGIGRIAILDSFAENALVEGFLAPEAVGTLITGDNHVN